MEHSSFFQNKQKRARLLFAIFFFFATILSGTLLFFAVRQRKIIDTEFPRLARLDQVYVREGLHGFLTEKELLKRQVIYTLRYADSPEGAHAATNVALYLFPETLPGDDFEREEAEALWVPLQKKIESDPLHPQSRTYFEQMRAQIWNYENPSRQAPQLSKYAKQVIHIYDVMSSTKAGEE